MPGGKKKKRKSFEKRIPKINIDVDINQIDYKDVKILEKFISRRCKILPRKITGLSAKKQRKLQAEIKKARIMGLLPFTDRHVLR